MVTATVTAFTMTVPPRKPGQRGSKYLISLRAICTNGAKILTAAVTARKIGSCVGKRPIGLGAPNMPHAREVTIA